MAKKKVLFGSLIVLIAAVIFLMLWRSHIMGPNARVTAGGLVAVSANGTPIPVPVALAATGPVPENLERALSGIPMRRLGTPEDVFQIMDFIVNSSSYITGQNYFVDGGSYMH